MHYIIIIQIQSPLVEPRSTYHTYTDYMFVYVCSLWCLLSLSSLMETSLWSSSSTLDGQTMESLFSHPLWSSSSSRSGKSLRALMHPLWCTAGEGERFGLELHWGGGRVGDGCTHLGGGWNVWLFYLIIIRIFNCNKLGGPMWNW